MVRSFRSGVFRFPGIASNTEDAHPTEPHAWDANPLVDRVGRVGLEPTTHGS